MKLQKSGKLYLLVHAALVAALLLFPLYRKITSLLGGFFSGCIIHDRLFLYCPLCGGTRALESLLRLDLVSAWHHNAFVVITVLLAVVLDLVALIRLLMGKQRLLPIPERLWIVGAASLVLYGVLRNYLMIAHGYDPVGDLGAFWSGLR